MGEAHAVVAVGDAVLTGGAVQQVDVGRTVRRGPGAVFWQVTCPRRAPTHGARLLQLAETDDKQRERGRRTRGDQDIWKLRQAVSRFKSKVWPSGIKIVDIINVFLSGRIYFSVVRIFIQDICNSIMNRRNWITDLCIVVSKNITQLVTRLKRLILWMEEYLQYI